MNQKKLYIWQLADFLDSQNKVMSVKELADHLNRNGFTTEYDEEYKGERGTLRLISVTYNWLSNDMDLLYEAAKVAGAFVKEDGTYAYE